MVNLLPFDGSVTYYGSILSAEIAEKYFTLLLNTIPWKQDEVMMFGKRIITKRKTAWYADNGNAYTYSNVTRKGLSWTDELTALKTLAEEISSTAYNSCLLNLYHDGNEGRSWHADDEKEIVPRSPVASLSLGATRKVLFKHKKNKHTIATFLQAGSLLLMKGDTQSCWIHSVPKSKKVLGARINLTFRVIIPPG